MSDELDLHDTRLLEDVVIHGVYLDLFKAKIDQRKEEIRVRACVGRDPRPAAFVKMVEKLTKWSGQQADALQTLKEMIEKSDSKVEAERTSAAASQKKKPKSYSSTKPPHHVKSSRKGKEARTSAH
ncbi:hypothetical protein SARC_00662 [Sphaeroforma arctica JP610]|uniref:PCI domain-containing protein n=1 Tax=Sphaeroforma arctica JP610 TaxID=667725 RepID=A0A0L0GDX4_9EUKA|nr:hypothetical protein SARC_00662 [Sphaeroforma arctica JP610]KNC87227.1 hypothetical protein SARC_00662 [Sphaeroforma arctica JP610]|eukprot:XP_014161129.1 hypothetical protein SARC_00662 [Sphaeroforma arctica JP610]